MDINRKVQASFKLILMQITIKYNLQWKFDVNWTKNKGVMKVEVLQFFKKHFAKHQY